VGDRELLPEETPNEFELSMISGHLTSEQRRLFEVAAKLHITQTKEATESQNEQLAAMAKRTVELAGNPLPVIKATIEKEFECELTIGEIASWLND